MFVKIDGVTCADDALLAVAAGADAIGFVLALSPRQVAPEVVRDIVGQVPASVLTLGVFVDEERSSVVETVRAVGLGGAQLHGGESAEDTRWVRERVGTVLKAFAAGDPALQQAADYGVDAVIVDSPVGGGSGVAYDWSLAGAVPAGTRLVLAGGLTPENVHDAIVAVRPWGVDVSSGVESSPGHKDARKLRAFVTAAKSALP